MSTVRVSQKKFTLRKLLIINKKKSSMNSNYYTSYERVFYTESFSTIFVRYMRTRLDKQKALFARVQKSTGAKVAYVMFE